MRRRNNVIHWHERYEFFTCTVTVIAISDDRESTCITVYKCNGDTDYIRRRNNATYWHERFSYSCREVYHSVPISCSCLWYNTTGGPPCPGPYSSSWRPRPTCRSGTSLSGSGSVCVGFEWTTADISDLISLQRCCRYTIVNEYRPSSRDSDLK